MNKISGLLVVLLCSALCTHATMRTWTGASGQTVEGEYIAIVFDSVMIKAADGREIKIPFDQLSPADRQYVDLKNPPELKIDYYDKGTAAKQVLANDWYDNGGGAHVNHPVFVMDARFGARIKQVSSKVYDYPLTIEMYVFTKQYLDPDKYHLIAHVTSEPFYLKKEKDFKYEWLEKGKHRIIFYNLYSEYPRGERLGEHLILVRDQEGNIVSYDASGNWLYKNLEQLQKLPLGAWLNDKCERVHPSSPKRFD